MDTSSPFDLVRRAARHASAADRWAALQSSVRAGMPVEPCAQSAQAQPVAAQARPEAVSAPEPPAQPGMTPARQSERPFPLQQPPFPPPHPRNPILDAIAQRHEQAARTAMPPIKWEKGGAGPHAPAAPEPKPEP